MEQQQKATVLRVILSAGCEYRLTAKGAVSIYNATSGRYVDTLKPSTVKALAESGHPVLQEFTSDQELMNSISENYAKSKEQTKILKQIQATEERANKMIQAALDLKKAAGLA